MGRPCTRSSDCAVPLTCAGGACRADCIEDRDCTTGTCEPFHGTGGVCVPPMSPRPCALNSDCGGGLFCRTGLCVHECHDDRDCDHGTCVDLGCSTPVSTEGGDAGVPGDGSICSTCGSRCVDLQNDREHCGSCGNACAPGQTCSAGTCADCSGGTCLAPNDSCLDALPIILRDGHATVATPDPTMLTVSPLSCGAPGVGLADSFYRLHLDVRSIVFLDVNNGDTRYNLSVGVVTDASCRTPGALCAWGNESAGTEAVLDAGDSVLVVTSQNAAVLTIWSVPIGPDAVAEPVGVEVGVAFTASVTLSGEPSPGTCAAGGPAHFWYGRSGSNGTLDLATCGTLATRAGVVRPTVAGPLCADQLVAACPGASPLHESIDAARPLVFFVAGVSAADNGPVTVSLTTGPI